MQQTLKNNRSLRGSSARCKNLYRFLQQRLGDELSDREIARRWPMDWSSFAKLKKGTRRLPRIEELDDLAQLLEVPSWAVFEVAMGVPAKDMSQLLDKGDGEALLDWFFPMLDTKELLRKANHYIGDGLGASQFPLQELVFLVDRDGTYINFIEGEVSPYVPPEIFLGRKVVEVLPGGVAAQLMEEIEIALSRDEVRKVYYELPSQFAIEQFMCRIIPLADDQILALARLETA